MSLRLGSVLLVLLLVPLVSYLVFASTIEAWVEHSFIQIQPSAWIVAATVATLLASDILLPIPSSFVCTFAGQTLGWILGTLVSFFGMSLGGLIGLTLSSWLGRPCIKRLCGQKTLADVESWSKRYGIWSIVLSRPIPLVAETVTLLLGLQTTPIRNWILPLLASNLFLAGAWSALGVWSHQGNWEWPAGFASILIPAALLVAWRLARRRPY